MHAPSGSEQALRYELCSPALLLKETCRFRGVFLNSLVPSKPFGSKNAVCKSKVCPFSSVYVVQDGGRVTCSDAATGTALYEQGRLGVEGAYHASPVAADGQIFFCSKLGTVTVVAAGDTLTVLASICIRSASALVKARNCSMLRGNRLPSFRLEVIDGQKLAAGQEAPTAKEFDPPAYPPS